VQCGETAVHEGLPVRCRETCKGPVMAGNQAGPRDEDMPTEQVPQGLLAQYLCATADCIGQRGLGHFSRRY